MILSKTSYLRNPPLKFLPSQVITFNAIRYSLDICEISFKRLIINLAELNNKGNNNINHQDFPLVFLDTWSIINNSVVFMKIICREFNLTVKEPYLQEIYKAKNLRDTNQHNDERLNQILSKEDLPIYGTLSWWKNSKKNDKTTISAIYSGSFTNKRKANISISNKSEFDKNLEIQRIELTSIIREGTKNNYTFREESVLIDNIIKELKWWTNHFDKQIEEQFKDIEIYERHRDDLIINLGGRVV